jgi:hypothetical protein
MITEEDLAGGELAGMSPEQRFRFIERLAARRLETRDSDGTWLYDDYDYMSSVYEAARLFEIYELLEWEMPRRTTDWEKTCRNFRAEAARVSQRILFEQYSLQEMDPNTVALDGKTKEIVRFHLGKVRSAIDTEAMPNWRKQDIYNAIAALEAEIDKARTRLTSVLDVIGKALEVPERLMGGLLKVVGIMQEAKKAEKEKAKLVASAKPKRIEQSKGKKLALQKPEKSTFDKLLDDEIPF